MIKQKFQFALLLLAISVFMYSCYPYNTVVGKGPQGHQEVTQWNHYIFWGLAPVGVSNPKVMADGATDYNVFTRQSFINGLLGGITFGIYTPTTTTVTK